AGGTSLYESIIVASGRLLVSPLGRGVSGWLAGNPGTATTYYAWAGIFAARLYPPRQLVQDLGLLDVPQSEAPVYDSRPIGLVRSSDPNDLVGPGGYG